MAANRAIDRHPKRAGARRRFVLRPRSFLSVSPVLRAHAVSMVARVEAASRVIDTCDRWLHRGSEDLDRVLGHYAVRRRFDAVIQRSVLDLLRRTGIF